MGETSLDTVYCIQNTVFLEKILYTVLFFVLFLYFVYCIQRKHLRIIKIFDIITIG